MNFKSARKQDSIAVQCVRQHQVKVMLNDEELVVLDEVRGRNSRAEVFRFLLNGDMPHPIPSFNLKAWQELSRSAANLNQIAYKLNTGESVEITEIQSTLSNFRAKLLGE